MMKFKLITALLLATIFEVSISPALHAQIDNQSQNNNIISLAGIWNFKLGPMGYGISSKGIKLADKLPGRITLPGSTDQAGKGYETNSMTSLRLTRLFEYKGAAWYQKEIYIPSGCQGKEVYLFLERAHWQTDVWINGKSAGKRNSLSTPHVYDITSLLKPGQENKIRVKVDNDKIFDIGSPHAISAETQTNWNGIIGKIQLRAFDKVHFKNIQVYPDIAHHQAKVHIIIENNTGADVSGHLHLIAHTTNSKAYEKTPAVQADFSGADSLITTDISLPMGDSVELWDAFHPSLYRLQVGLNADKGNEHYQDIDSVTFGMRDFSTNGTQFTINGKPVFIRSDVNSAESPITGYPAMDKTSWLHVFKVCKAYGLNAMRFHSWCPPEAAFEAADQMGFYLQIENSDWRFNVGKDPATDAFLAREADRILKTYGNHPSFTMLCEGNELVGPKVDSFLTSLVQHWKKEDPRHIYTGSSGYPVIAANQYDDFYGPRLQHWKEGLKGRLNKMPLNTEYDYASYVGKQDIPLVSHEVGQWCVYPDFSHLNKYTGVLKPYNYELFRESLRNHHMLNLARKFMMASGKFQVIQKKEELEALLRTPGLGGYELLELEDYPGQGTAPVGVVDAFWDPKPYVAARQFHEFESAEVPLLKTSSFTWTNDQAFKGLAEFANYGEHAIKDAAVHWSLAYPDGKVYEKGVFDKTNLPLGDVHKLGNLSIPLNNILQATSLRLTIYLNGKNIINHWRIWVYPKQLPKVALNGVTIAHKWNDKVKKLLQNGGKVLLLADTADIVSDVPPGFSGISWNTVWSGTPPNSLGILCAPQHPALKDFPTQYYSNWQWWDLVRHSKPMLMDSMPPSFLPIVQVIPDWNKNNKIGLVFEAKVGKGKLLMTSIDLTDEMDKRPVARQMLYNLEKYISSADFSPERQLDTKYIDQLFEKDNHLSYYNDN